MKLFVVVLLINNANVIFCDRVNEVQFPPEVLQPDLEAIEKYYKNINNEIEAYIHWPHDIVFSVKREQLNNEDYLKINGNFKRKTIVSILTTTFDNLYYKEKQFYIKNSKMRPIEMSAILYYKPNQATINSKAESYLSIGYKSIDEVERAIDPMISMHSYFWRFASSPSTYLATWDEQFLEYNTWSNTKKQVQADGGLLTLTGTVKGNKVIMYEASPSYRLIFDQNQKIFKIPYYDNPIPSFPFVEYVFGVRMQNVGFLAEVRGRKIKMLSSDDFGFGTVSAPTNHMVFVDEFRQKMSRVEPKRCKDNDETCLQYRPKLAQFQIKGHVLTKRINYDGESIDKECPFVIENERQEMNFMFGTVETNYICTDNLELWVPNRKSPYDPKEVITLFYP